MKKEQQGKGLRDRSDTKAAIIGIVETDGKVIVKVTDWVAEKTAKDLIGKHIEAGSNYVRFLGTG